MNTTNSFMPRIGGLRCWRGIIAILKPLIAEEGTPHHFLLLGTTRRHHHRVVDINTSKVIRTEPVIEPVSLPVQGLMVGPGLDRF
jgi:hypothetical protein